MRAPSSSARCRARAPTRAHRRRSYRSHLAAVDDHAGARTEGIDRISLLDHDADVLRDRPAWGSMTVAILFMTNLTSRTTCSSGGAIPARKLHGVTGGGPEGSVPRQSIRLRPSASAGATADGNQRLARQCRSPTRRRRPDSRPCAARNHASAASPRNCMRDGASKTGSGSDIQRQAAPRQRQARCRASRSPGSQQRPPHLGAELQPRRPPADLPPPDVNGQTPPSKQQALTRAQPG